MLAFQIDISRSLENYIRGHNYKNKVAWAVMLWSILKLTAYDSSSLFDKINSSFRYEEILLYDHGCMELRTGNVIPL